MNLFQLPLLPLDEELTTIIAENKNIRIERIISTGQTTDWYDQEETEFVALLSGCAKLEFQDGSITTLEQGDTVIIPPHSIHRVMETSQEPPCVWLCVFY